jgi:hypothetical protein
VTFVDLSAMGALQINGPAGIQSWGDYAVVSIYDQFETSFNGLGTALIVVQLSSGKSWRVSRSAGGGITTFSPRVDGTHLYYGEWGTSPVSAGAPMAIVRLLRIELAKIAEAPNVSPL